MLILSSYKHQEQMHEPLKLSATSQRRFWQMQNKPTSFLRLIKFSRENFTCPTNYRRMNGSGTLQVAGLRLQLSKKNSPGAVADEISAEQLEELFMRARQTVKPIINRRDGD